ncbi:N-acetyltransferase [Halosegnis rubeus]|uniref:N-acetyltransferase n=1 Tax=Halosegnis rubeus TaxID=2212850 RepID=A0A5N5U7P5_9EURY|nr:acyltransferase [Halosegnis rubeus]KAB7514660.1 N-acetyltransferase [Halosegnis rubeus]
MSDYSETNVNIDPGASLGHEYDEDTSEPVIGPDATVRSGTIIYDDVTIGKGLTTGHNALIREHTTIGDDVIIGTNTVIDGQCDIGSSVSMQTNVYVPTNTVIGNNVFLGPNAVLTNDPYPVRDDATLKGPTVRDGASVGANATVLPDVTIGQDAFVAAGATVTKDVPAETLAVGTPATHQELPESLQGGNEI